jgi:uncharacterized protein
VARAVLDANVILSAAINPAGAPGQVIDRLCLGGFEMVLSPAIVSEVLRVFGYRKFDRALRLGGDPVEWFQGLALLAESVEGSLDVRGVCADADDDKYLAAAIEDGAEYLVTGDRALLVVDGYRGLKVVPPRRFLTILDDVPP